MGWVGFGGERSGILRGGGFGNGWEGILEGGWREGWGLGGGLLWRRNLEAAKGLQS